MLTALKLPQAEPMNDARTGARTLDLAIARSAIVFRCSWCALTVPAAIAVGGPESTGVWRTAAVVAVVLWGWAVWCVCRRQRRLPAGLVHADALLFALLLLAADVLLPRSLIGDGGTWVCASASVTVFLASWALLPYVAVLVTMAEMAAYGGGLALANVPVQPGAVLATVVVYPVQLVLGLLVVRLMRRIARTADDALTRQAQAQQRHAVDAAQAKDAYEQRLLLHDTVLSTLTAVARGIPSTRAALVRQRASQDLTRMEGACAIGPALAPRCVADVVEGAVREATLRGITLHACATRSLMLPPETAQAVSAALREGLSNIEQHAGVNTALLTATVTADGFVVGLQDFGSGFVSSASSPEAGWGLRRSIQQRMIDVGGLADVVSVPGAGTTVTLRWSAKPSEGGRPSDLYSTLLTSAYATGFSSGLTRLALYWHLFSGYLILASWHVYAHPEAEAAAWAALLGIVIWLIRRPSERGLSARQAWTLVVVIVSVSVLAVLGCPGHALIGKANWVYGGSGWFLVAVLTRRPAHRMMPTLLIVPVSGLIAVCRTDADGAGLMVSLMLVVVYFQLGALAMDAVLRGLGATAATSFHHFQQPETAHRARDEVRRHRALRYRELEEWLVPVVQDLADGSLHPGNQHDRTRAWAAAAALRVHLRHDRACEPTAGTDISTALSSCARRHGVAAEVRADVDEVPAIVLTVLSKTAARVLAHAQPGDAEIVLRGAADEAILTVCLPTTTPVGELRRAATAVAAASPGITTTATAVGQGRVWLQARWQQ
ncbi:hypothetical protein OHT57_00560 [Streptomyces sp. NBC_00285]|uniref:sensor histidine kinase n=1 Tax=Streptomyces sp. NBC_00285 TaxID=2975700 RepID=UPI002E2ACF65|nr:hypothetical protein [Streptomyces sp. NBC_00285]